MLVSFSSTAQFNPKLLYGQEPWLRFGFKLLGEEENESSRELMKLIEKMKEHYAYSERVWVPETWEEFELIIKRFIEERQNTHCEGK